MLCRSLGKALEPDAWEALPSIWLTSPAAASPAGGNSVCILYVENEINESVVGPCRWIDSR